MESRKEKMYEYLRKRQATGEIPPSLSEIAEGCGIGSTSTVREYLAVLEMEGLISWERGKNRSVRVVGLAETEDAERVQRIPVMGDSGAVMLDAALVDGDGLIAVPGRLFARSVVGAGDYVIVDTADVAVDGELVVTRESSGLRLRKYHSYMLEAVSGDDPVMIESGRTPEGIEIIGVVRLEIRR